MWLGSYYHLRFNKHYLRSKHYVSKKLKNKVLWVGNRFYLNPLLRFYFPYGWNLTIIRKIFTYFYFYFNTYFFLLVLPNIPLKININPQTSTVYIKNFLPHPEFKFLIKTINLLFSMFYKLFFIKLKFKGKGYYLYKNIRNTVTPQFGYAHRIYKYSYYVSVKFLSKTKVFFYGISKNDLFITSSSIRKIRPINIFTGRGVRFTKTVVYKKTGKISSYR